MVFWVKISEARASGDLEKFSPWLILAVTGLGTAVITSFLFITFIIASLLRLPMKSVLAVTVLSCARNSSIAIAVIDNLPDNVGDKHLMFFPIVFVYLAMVVIINSFGCFMTVKKEENDIEGGIDSTEDKVDAVEKLTIIVSSFEQTTSSDQAKINNCIVLSSVQWCTAV